MAIFTAHKGSRYNICEKGDAWLYRNKKKSRDRNGDRNSRFKQLTGSFFPAHKADVPSPHRQNRHIYFARATAVVAALQVYLALVFVNANVCFVKFYRFKNFHKHQRMSATCPRLRRANGFPGGGAWPAVTASAGARGSATPASPPQGLLGVEVLHVVFPTWACHSWTTHPTVHCRAEAGLAPGRRLRQLVAGRLVQVAIAARRVGVWRCGACPGKGSASPLQV